MLKQSSPAGIEKRLNMELRHLSKKTVSVISCSLGFPSGKLAQLWKITIFMGNLTISMAIFHSYVSLPEEPGNRLQQITLWIEA